MHAPNGSRVGIQVLGPKILVDSLVPRTSGFKHGNRWQYHSRSDHHSKVACWALLFDLLRHCALLRDHAARGLVGYGLNHEMGDFRTARKKNLDLVVCRPRGGPLSGPPAPSFSDQALEIGVALDSLATAELAALPRLDELPVGAVHVALEAKACMTAFGKARPRLYDELNSSHLAIHGNSPHTIAAGLAMVNAAETFISPGRNDFDLSSRPAEISRHTQPRDAASVIVKLRELPRRSRDGEEGYDVFAITVVNCRNDGSPVTLVTDPPAPQAGDVDHYEMAVHRLAQLYEQKYRGIAL
jgi:hypothetical protein